MDTLLKIGELAKLLDSSTSSIRYYEKEGLIKPSKIDSNKYRLYDFEQLDILENIMLLRDLNVSIETIKDLYSDYSPQKYEHVMNKAIDLINQEMKMLKARKSNIKSRLIKLKEIQETKNMYRFVQKKARSIVVFHTGNGEDFSIRDFYSYFEKYQLPIEIVKEDLYFSLKQDKIYESGILAEHIPKHHQFSHCIDLPAGNYLIYGCFCVLEDDIFDKMEQFQKYLVAENITYNGPIIICEKIKYHEYDMSKKYIEFQVRC